MQYRTQTQCISTFLLRYSSLLYAVAFLFIALSSADAKSFPSSTKQPSNHTHKELKLLTPPQLARLALPSIVRLTVLNSQGQPSIQGSGVVVGANLIVTNIHVIANAHAVTANFENGRSEAVYGIVAQDSNSDLALLYADTTGIKPLPLALGAYPQIGDPVAAVGSPEGLGGSLSTGIISGFRQIGSVQVIQTTAPTSHGSSGGALMDMYGRVLGITSFTFMDGQNINFAYRSYYIYPLLPRKIATYTDWWELERDAEIVAGIGHTDQPLLGLKTVTVYVDDVGADAKQDGLDTGKIKASIESKLLKNNIKIFDGKNFSENASEAVFRFCVVLNKASSGATYDYNAALAVEEDVEVRHSGSLFTRAETWQCYNQSSVESSVMARSIYDLADKSVEMFVKAYHDQNPK